MMKGQFSKKKAAVWGQSHNIGNRGWKLETTIGFSERDEFVGSVNIMTISRLFILVATLC